MKRKANDIRSPAAKKALLAQGRTEPWTGTIYGQPYSKANSRKIVKFGDSLRSIKSDQARSYAAGFLRQCPTLDPLFEGDVFVEIMIYYASRRPDLDESLILDLLQGRIYRNDRQVRGKHVLGAVDAGNPRAIITVSPVEVGPRTGCS